MKNQANQPRRLLRGEFSLAVLICPLLALCAALPQEAICQVQNKALYIQRTEHTGGDGTQAISRRGGFVDVPIPDTLGKFSVGFWIQRDLANDKNTSDPSRKGGFMILRQDIVTAQHTRGVMSSTILPEDEQWHYMFYTFEYKVGSGNDADTVDWKWYLDGVQTETAGGIVTLGAKRTPSSYFGIRIGCDGIGIIKKASSLNMLVDDIAMWDRIDESILALASDIAFFGNDLFDPEDSRLVFYKACNDTSSVPFYSEDAKTLPAGKSPNDSPNADITKNQYTIEEDPVFRFGDASTNRQKLVRVTVSSDYGLGLSPQRGVTDSAFDASGNTFIQFLAPDFIYLDRYRNELGTSDDADLPSFIDRAFYRVRNVGYAIQVGANPSSLGTAQFFSQPLSDDIDVTWRWDLEYALIIQSATSELTSSGGSLAGSPPLGDPTINGENAKVGKHWIPAGNLTRTAIDALIDDATAQEAIPERFETRGYTIENAPGSSDLYLAFNGSSSQLEVTPMDIEELDNFSVDFWARRDLRDTIEREEILVLRTGSGLESTVLIRIGIRPTINSTNPKGMFIATGTDPAAVDAEIPGSLVDDTWHHWAWTNDVDAGTLLCYRDGKVVGTFPAVEPGGVRYQTFSGDNGFPAFPSHAILESENVMESEAFDTTQEWLVKTNILTVSIPETSGGAFARGPLTLKSTDNNMVYKGLNLQAGDYRLISRGIGQTNIDSNISIFINGHPDRIARLTQPRITEAQDGFWTNYPSDSFTVGAPITELKVVWETDSGFFRTDQFEFQAKQEDPATVTQAQALWITGSKSGGQSDLVLPAGLSPTYSAAELKTLVRIDEGGAYQFQLASLGGSVLEVDGTTVIDNDGIHPSEETMTGEITLTPGFHQLSVGFFQTETTSNLDIKWRPPGGADFVAIPGDRFDWPLDVTAASIGNGFRQDFGFKGGIDNIRVWKKVLTADDVADASATEAYGADTDGLEMEFSFDTPDIENQVSDEGNSWVGEMNDFGTWGKNFAAAFETTTAILEFSDPVDLVAPYTIEALVSFPLPETPGGLRTLFETIDGSGSGSPVVIDPQGELGSFGGFSGDGFHGTGYRVSDLSGWHMVAVVSTSSGTDFYIDGIIVGSNAFVAGQPLKYIGNSSFGGQPVGVVDEIRLWSGVRRQTALEANAITNLFGNELGLVFLLNFVDGTGKDQSGNGNDAVFMNGAGVVPFVTGGGEIAGVTVPGGDESDRLAALFPEFSNQPRTSDDSVDGTIHTDDIPIQDWVRVIWNWDRTLQLNVTASPPENQNLVFLKVDGVPIPGKLAKNVWVPAGADVVVGTQYRSTDRCVTLHDIYGQTNGFQGVTMDTVSDGVTLKGAATREYEFAALEEPGSLVFNFTDTVYRAVLPLGEGLDLSSPAALNDQIVPNLCDSAQIDVTSTAPQQTGSDGLLQGAVGDSTEWDFVGRKFYVVQPGIFTNLWPDIDPLDNGRSITVASGFPDSTVETTWQIEDDQGFRLDTSGERIVGTANEPTTIAVLPSTSDEFPASPSGHYHYLAGANTGADTDQTVPTELDADPGDRWFFERASFLGESASVDNTLKRFTANAEGRSVLVYRYRPDPSQIATGNPRLEAVAVRIVDAIRWRTIRSPATNWPGKMETSRN